MWNIKKFSWKPWTLLRTVHSQNFSVLFMKEKQFEPPVYDVLIQDFDEQDLHDKISTILSKPYLQPLKENELKSQKRRAGIIYGGGGRGLISLPTWNTSVNPIWIHYLIDTGSPYNYLSKEALEALKVDDTQNMFSVIINGHACPAK